MEGRHTLLHPPVSTAALCPLGNHHQTEPSGRDSVLVISAAPGPDTGLDSGCCINGGLLDGGRLTWEVQYIIVKRPDLGIRRPRQAQALSFSSSGTPGKSLYLSTLGLFHHL